MEILKKEIEIYYRVWDDVGNPKACLQIFHGMVEHVSRYDDFAKFLNENGIVVYGMDIRGHGQTGLHSHLGYFDKKDGWNKVLQDQRDLLKLMKDRYHKLPFFLLGHSMGSFLARDYINKFRDDFDCAIIMATGNAHDFKYGFARTILKYLNPLKPAKLMNNLAFASYNKQISNPRTQFDWISNDENQVNKYINDPLCGFLVKNSFYKDFMYGMKSIADYEKTTKLKIPILFVAGLDDPVGNKGEYVTKTARYYPNKKVILYENMRHEILNEINNIKVYKDLLSWIEHNQTQE